MTVLCAKIVTATASMWLLSVTRLVGIPLCTITATPPDNLLAWVRSRRMTVKPFKKFVCLSPKFVSCRHNATGEKVFIMSFMSPKLCSSPLQFQWMIKAILKLKGEICCYEWLEDRNVW